MRINKGANINVGNITCIYFLWTIVFLLESNIYCWIFLPPLLISMEWLYRTCSMKFREKLLVEADVFYHFRGLILCNAKCLQFHQNLKNKNIGSQLSKYYITLCIPFFIDVVIGSVCAAKKIIVTAPLSFLIDAG